LAAVADSDEGVAADLLSEDLADLAPGLAADVAEGPPEAPAAPEAPKEEAPSSLLIMKVLVGGAALAAVTMGGALMIPWLRRCFVITLAPMGSPKLLLAHNYTPCGLFRGMPSL